MTRSTGVPGKPGFWLAGAVTRFCVPSLLFSPSSQPRRTGVRKGTAIAVVMPQVLRLFVFAVVALLLQPGTPCFAQQTTEQGPETTGAQQTSKPQAPTPSQQTPAQQTT